MRDINLLAMFTARFLAFVEGSISCTRTSVFAFFGKRSIVALILVALSVQGFAQQTEPQNEAKAESTTTDEKKPDPQPKKDDKTSAEEARSFNPSEEISEDLSVPFPVDI